MPEYGDDEHTRFSFNGVDFNCRFEPEQFACEFLEKVNFNPDTKLPYKQYRQLMLEQYSFLLPADVDSLYNYIYYEKSQGRKCFQTEESFDNVEITVNQFVKFSYLFYRYSEILKEPRFILFYFLDDNFNKHINLKNFKSLCRVHYGLDVKQTREVFRAISPKEGYINMQKFVVMLEVFDKCCLTDDCIFLFKQPRANENIPENFDREMKEPRESDLFSDISNRRRDIDKALKANREKQKKDAEKRKRNQKLDNLEAKPPDEPAE